MIIKLIIGLLHHKNKLYLFGGFNGSEWLNDFYALDLGSMYWERVEGRGTGLSPTPRFGFVAVVYEGRVVLFGGFDGRSWMKDMYEFDIGRGEWREVNPSGKVPSRRSCPSWCLYGNKVYVFGGFDGLRRMDDLYACDLDTYCWEEIVGTGEKPLPRYFHSAVVHDHRMFVFGGFNGSSRLNDLHSFNLSSRHWERVENIRC